MSAVSTLVNIAKWKNFLFRNYNLPPSVYSDYPGNCKQKVWEVVMASSAAPAFYKEKTLEEYIFRVNRKCSHSNITELFMHSDVFK